MPRPTNNDIYDLVDSRLTSLRLETKSDLKEIRDELNALSRTVSDQGKAQAVDSTKIGFIITGVSLVVSSITTVVMEKITGKTIL
jgi:hypothetical protein